MRDALNFDPRVDDASVLNGIGEKFDANKAARIEDRIQHYSTNCRANILRDSLRISGISSLAIAGLSTDQDIDEIFVGVTSQSHVVGGIRCNGKGIVLETLNQMLSDTSHGQVTFFNVSSQEHAMQMAIKEIGLEGFRAAVADVSGILTDGGIES